MYFESLGNIIKSKKKKERSHRDERFHERHVGIERNTESKKARVNIVQILTPKTVM